MFDDIEDGMGVIRGREETTEWFAGQGEEIHYEPRESYPTEARRQELRDATSAFVRMCADLGHDLQPGVSLQLKEGSSMIGNWHVCRKCGREAQLEIHDDLTRQVDGSATVEECQDAVEYEAQLAKTRQAH
jgi:hypothetical protein